MALADTQWWTASSARLGAHFFSSDVLLRRSKGVGLIGRARSASPRSQGKPMGGFVVWKWKGYAKQLGCSHPFHSSFDLSEVGLNPVVQYIRYPTYQRGLCSCL